MTDRIIFELFPIIAKKLPFPGHAAYGFGAIAEEHAVYVSEYLKTRVPL